MTENQAAFSLENVLDSNLLLGDLDNFKNYSNLYRFEKTNSVSRSIFVPRHFLTSFESIQNAQAAQGIRYTRIYFSS